jgi:ABC-type nitrate/sulfonate/bicarbonate transport system permease component
MSRRGATRLILPIVSILLLLGLWQVVVVAFHVQAYIAPRPLDAIRAVTGNWSLLAPLVLQIVKETIYGFVGGALVGVFFGVVMAKIPLVQRLLYPTLIVSQAVPVIAIAFPLAAILGFGTVRPIVAIVIWIVFFPVTVNVIDGLAHVDHDLMNLARVYGASKWRTFWHIEVPATISPLFSGLKIGATYAITGAFIGELASPETVGPSQSSLYIYVQHANSNFDQASVFGITLLMAFIGVTWFLIVSGVETFSTPWLRRSTVRHWRRRHRRSSPSLRD